MIINTIVLKIASRCNINCTYCYMFNHDDQSYIKLPKFFSKENVLHLRDKIKNHCLEHELKSFFIIFHGGEPLLYPKEMFRFLLQTLIDLKEFEIDVHFAMQTNGILIDQEYCKLFNEFKVGLGISLDGRKEINDKYRVDKKGNGTYDQVVAGISIANEFLKNPLGCLSVVNAYTNPIDSYENYKDLKFKSIDFLMLDENYDTAASISDALNKQLNSKWFIQLFDYWYAQPDSIRLSFRKFEIIISYILGNGISVDGIGANKNQVMVVETDGGFEPVDVLKICGDSFTKIQLNVATNEINQLFDSSLVQVYHNSGSYLCRKCLACPVKDICGGGYLPHRYSSENGFNNPSIYCNDLLHLITYIQNKVVDSLPEELKQETGIEKITYERALQMIEENLPNTPEPEYVEQLESFRKKQYA
jgi:uncharacterized protein